jgi:hypothetical protein
VTTIVLFAAGLELGGLPAGAQVDRFYGAAFEGDARVASHVSARLTTREARLTVYLTKPASPGPQGIDVMGALLLFVAF